MDESIQIIADYFGRSNAAQAAANELIPNSEHENPFDVVLKFGSEVAVVETKFVKVFDPKIIENARHQIINLTYLYKYMNSENLVDSRVHSVIIVFVEDKIPENYKDVQNLGDDLHIVVVQV